MKRPFAIVFSLLLIAAMVHALTPVSRGQTKARCGCFENECPCCLGHASSATAPPVESTAPSTASIQHLAPAREAVVFMLAQSENAAPRGTASESPTGAVPLFRRNCALLI